MNAKLCNEFTKYSENIFVEQIGRTKWSLFYLSFVEVCSVKSFQDLLMNLMNFLGRSSSEFLQTLV